VARGKMACYGGFTMCAGTTCGGRNRIARLREAVSLSVSRMDVRNDGALKGWWNSKVFAISIAEKMADSGCGRHLGDLSL